MSALPNIRQADLAPNPALTERERLESVETILAEVVRLGWDEHYGPVEWRRLQTQQRLTSERRSFGLRGFWSGTDDEARAEEDAARSDRA